MSTACESHHILSCDRICFIIILPALQANVVIFHAEDDDDDGYLLNVVKKIAHAHVQHEYIIFVVASHTYDTPKNTKFSSSCSSVQLVYRYIVYIYFIAFS